MKKILKVLGVILALVVFSPFSHIILLYIFIKRVIAKYKTNQKDKKMANMLIDDKNIIPITKNRNTEIINLNEERKKRRVV